MTEEPLVSAIIPARNAEEFIGDALRSVLAQTHTPIECIVVDDGSDDATAERARGIDPAVEVITQSHRGVAAARNRGAEAASGSFLAFLDADDTWLPERTERLLSAIEMQGADAAVSAVTITDAELGPIAVHRQGPDVDVPSVLLCEVELVSTSSNLLINRALFDAVGAFDPRLSTAADWSLTLRLLDAGELAYVDEPLTLYRRHGGNMSRAVAPMEHDMRLVYDELFGDPARTDLAPIRRRAYARLHRVLAGSYFSAGQWRDFARNAAKSIGHHPAELGYFLSFPIRRTRR
jgi:glycosyltransferase involved in cell wall biosynthesis